MALTVQAAFDQFYQRINLDTDLRKTANSRRDRLVALLEKTFSIVEAFPTGSIPRFTALKAYADVDVIIALHYGKHIKGKQPSQVLQAVRDALAEYRTNVRKNGQAVTLYFDTRPNVDVVPAAQLVDDAGSVTGYSIPDMEREVWLTSRPRRHTSNVDQLATSCGQSFRRIIKMAKYWSRTHSDYLQSYHLEAMAVNTFGGLLTDLPWDTFQFFENASRLIKSPLLYEGAHVDDYLGYEDRCEAANRLAKASDLARDAWLAASGVGRDHAKAIDRWRVLFGEEFPRYG